MPIDDWKGSRQVEFGTGDIVIDMGLLEDEKDPIGVIIFRETGTPGAIGVRTDYEKPISLEPGEYPVRLIFTRTESIDSLIRCLEDTKEKMITNNIRAIKKRDDPNV